MKKTLSILIAGVIMIILTACSQSFNNSNASETKKDNEAQSAQTDQEMEKSNKETNSSSEQTDKSTKNNPSYETFIDKPIDGGKGQLVKITTSDAKSEGELRKLAKHIHSKKEDSDFVKVIILKEKDGHPGRFLAKAFFANNKNGANKFGLDSTSDYKFIQDEQ